MGAGVLVLIILGVLAVRWIRNRAPEMERRGKAVVAEARKFAEGKQSNDCVEEGLRRSAASKDFLGMVAARVFVNECLQVATEPPEFCANVPSGVLDGASWTNDQCAKRKLAGDQGCVGVYQSVIQHCQTSRSPR
jgi:hypothetical protein